MKSLYKWSHLGGMEIRLGIGREALLRKASGGNDIEVNAIASDYWEVSYMEM
jgi:hypothetical protein